MEKAAVQQQPSDLVTRRELAGRLEVVMQTVTKWEQDGMPVFERGRKGKPSTYSETAVRAWLTEREARAKASGLVDVAQERARKERAQAQLAEQMHAQRAGKLLSVDEVTKIWAAEVTAIRAILLASYTNSADRVFRAATMEGLPGVEREMKSVAYEALRKLADPERDIPVSS